MPLITDWIMVIITLAYVAATIAILCANRKTVELSGAQLEELKRQYEEENRPRIEMEFHYERRTWYILRFVNHGRLTAQNVKIDLSQDFINSLPEEEFKKALTRVKTQECVIGVENHFDLPIASNALRGNPNMKPVIGKISYKSRGRAFEENISLDLAQYMTFFSYTTEEEDLLKTLKTIEKDLCAIKGALDKREKSEDS